MASPGQSTSSDRAAGASDRAAEAERPRRSFPGDRTTLGLAGVLLVVYSALAVVAMAEVDRTVDEPTYFNSGRVILEAGWEEPITRLHGPLPYYANQLLVPDFPPGGYDENEEHEGLLLRGRLGLLPFGWLAGAIVFLWSRRAFGNAAGLFSLTLYALNPLIVGYSGLLAVDIAHTATVLLAFATLWRTLERPSFPRAALVGAALGLSFSTKYLALLNAPLVVLVLAGRIVWVRWRPGRTGRGVLAGAGAAAVATAAALLVLHATYLFRPGFAPGDPDAYQSRLIGSLVEVPVVGDALRLFPGPFLLGVDYQMSVGEAEHFRPYLNGTFALGHPDYYLWVFLLKTPEWLLLVLACFLVIELPRQLFGRAPPMVRWSAWVLVPPALLTLSYLSFFTALQIGVRYVLPLYPMLFILCGGLASRGPVARLAPGKLTAAWLLLLALQAADLVRHRPSWIGYVNAVAGGPGRVYRHFNDSNADWGHGIRPGLAHLRATEEGLEVVTLFGGPRFGTLGIQLRHLVRKDREDERRMRHWLLALEPARHFFGAWWVFESTPEAWEQALLERPDGGSAERSRADLVVAYLGEGRIEDARRHLAKLGAERAEPLRRLADLCESVARGSDPAAQPAALVAAWERVGRHDLALELLRDHPGLRDLPDRPLRMASALVKEGRVDEAIELLEGVDPAGLPRAALRLARTYAHQNRFAEAESTLAGALPHMDGELRGEAEAYLAEVREQGGRWSRFFGALR